MTFKVLVIEDFEPLRNMYCDMLKRFNYDIITAETGIDGLKNAQEEHPDLILLDVDLPYMSGLEVLYRLRQEPATSQTPVLIVSGNHHVQNSEIASEADLFLIKPVRPSDLIKFVQKLLPIKTIA